MDLIIPIPIPYRYQTKIHTDTDTDTDTTIIIPIPIPILVSVSVWYRYRYRYLVSVEHYCQLSWCWSRSWAVHYTGTLYHNPRFINKVFCLKVNKISFGTSVSDAGIDSWLALAMTLVATISTVIFFLPNLSFNFNLVEKLSSFNFIFNTNPPTHQKKFKRPLNINLTIVSTSVISLLKDS